MNPVYIWRVSLFKVRGLLNMLPKCLPCGWQALIIVMLWAAGVTFYIKQALNLGPIRIYYTNKPTHLIYIYHA
jgi:hypothetical protein